MLLKLFVMLHTILASFTSPIMYYDEYESNIYNASQFNNTTSEINVYAVFSSTRYV